MQFRFLKILKAEFIMMLGEIRSYYINYIFFNIGYVFLFIGLFLSFSFDDKNSSIVLLLGLVGWNIGNSSLGYLPAIVKEEAQFGTLEQIFMTRTSIYEILFSKVIVGTLFDVFKGSIIFLICANVFGVFEYFVDLGFLNIMTLILIYFIVSFSFSGIGLIFAGMSLSMKRVNSIVYVLSYILLFFSGVTVDTSSLPNWINNIFSILPLRWFKEVLEVLVFNKDNTILKQPEFFIFLSVSVTWVIVGSIMFKVFINSAKKKGKLGHY